MLYKGLKILKALLNSFDTLHSYNIYSNNKFLQQKDVKKPKKAIIKLNWNMPMNYLILIFIKGYKGLTNNHY